MQRYYPVVRVLSLVILMFGLTMLVPWGLSWVLHDGAQSAFDEAVPADRRLPASACGTRRATKSAT